MCEDRGASYFFNSSQGGFFIAREDGDMGEAGGGNIRENP